MERMVRKQMYLSPRNDQYLKRRARATGLSEAEVVRHVLDCAEDADADRPDLRAWESLKRVMEERAQLDVPQVQWVFNREELYEE